ncbi:hypothetical protein EUX98_g8117 [Antrodiella citrinella]|uniref:Glutamine amidotransferase domain-containing protein n=1 Tax=Antrodiella citrinella TaxID=2447956 RepID=A0A4S4MEH3_9APHY|nr:hypothetical protein EUX98_g8117 [Antrodiella citrinella]
MERTTYLKSLPDDCKFQHSIREHIEYRLDSYDVKEKLEYPKPENLDNYDAIILTGSAASAYENLQWINLLVAYIASVAEEKPHIKLIGAFAFYSENIQQMHRDHIPEVPKSCHLLASTSITPNQGFIRLNSSAPPPNASSPVDLKDIQIFTVQGHPEFTKPIVSTIVDARSATGVIDQATAELARSRADWPNDGVDKLGKVIWGIMSAKA